jgi:hypothetical protein
LRPGLWQRWRLLTIRPFGASTPLAPAQSGGVGK